MDTSNHIPQDIINEVLEHLDGLTDRNTLKACALTSHSLLLLSRKRLFSTIRLDKPSLVNRLYELFIRNSSLSTLIHDLHIHVLPVRQTDTLPVILSMMTKLRRLMIGRPGLLRYWETISTTLQMAFEELFKHPTLHTVGFISVMFPASLLYSLYNIKTVFLVKSSILSDDSKPHLTVLPMQLRSVHFSRGVTEGTWPKLNAPAFRQLSIEGTLARSLGVVHAIINSNAHTLEHIICSGNIERFTEPYLYLGVIANLRKLSFEIVHETISTTDMMSSVVKMLSTPSVTQHLEEIDIAGENPAGAEFLFDAGTSKWAELDKVLSDNSRCPRLRTIKIHLEDAVRNSAEDEGNIRLISSNLLPLFNVKGAVSVKLYKNFTLDLLL